MYNIYVIGIDLSVLKTYLKISNSKLIVVLEHLDFSLLDIATSSDSAACCNLTSQTGGVRKFWMRSGVKWFSGSHVLSLLWYPAHFTKNWTD